MSLAFAAFVAGLLTVLSPCILPVLPFVFARNDRPFAQGMLPLLAGIVASFAAVASLGAVAGAWAVQLNLVGRWIALVALALFAASLLWPRLAAWWSAPAVRAGERLSRIQSGSAWRSSALLGTATGLIWTPCAGPVLGVVLSTAALAGPGAHTALLLVSYGVGAALALTLALRIGAGPLAALKARLLPHMAGRRVAGAVMLAGVVAVATGLDTVLLARLAAPGATGLETALLQRAIPNAEAAEPAGARPGAPRPSLLPIESTRVSLEGGVQWHNASPQSIAALHGKVVLVNFWTYSCVNCLRTLPYVKAWAQKYADRGLVVVGVHTPEFAFEKDAAHVKRALQDLKIYYPVVQDNDYRIWRGFDNQYWPALYFIDGQGRVRHHQFGEGGYAASERVIEELLREAGSDTASPVPPNVQPDTRGPGLAADAESLRSPETYLGYEKGRVPRVTGSVVPDQPVHYMPTTLRPDTWSLAGTWAWKPEFVEGTDAGGSVAVRFQARDVNLVLGKGITGPVRFRLTLDGRPPGADHGTDVDADGNGVVDATRLYQLVHQSGTVKARTVEIRFLEPGARAYAFTFG
ncbi:cytochrome c biogenesis protein DipZ [Variovorax sp. J22P168]|uniref:cytochrome c biogenesis protein DipZ n=1 Tax=Variovorax jilinensis TaxID=3053513 RepID=UPI0025751308|nr:cytochrome c biogenesis protein DipZ [Variovorax sp. J22P168]MDM0015815.1 cytochrome c biogenesis protein DipZ [Variovorax sp. J22P168]